MAIDQKQGHASNHVPTSFVESLRNGLAEINLRAGASRAAPSGLAAQRVIFKEQMGHGVGYGSSVEFWQSLTYSPFKDTA